MSPSSQASSVPLSCILVARFLRSNRYTETLDAFIREAGLPHDVGAGSNGKEWTIEGLLKEKRTYDYSADFERRAEGDEINVWRVPGQLYLLAVG